MAVAEKAVLT